MTFPWKIYGDDPNWVPPLIFTQLQFFTPGVAEGAAITVKWYRDAG